MNTSPKQLRPSKNMKKKGFLSAYIVYPNKLVTEHYLRGVPGSLIYRENEFADLTYEVEFEGLASPSGKIVKMSKKKYVDSFFETGLIQLGTIDYYRSLGHSEQGDEKEGAIVLVGRGTTETGFAQITSGFNHYVFCCYDGSPNPDIIDRFGYDDYYVIEEPELFMKAIGKKVSAKEAYRSRCIYKKEKVLIGDVPEGFDFRVMSPRLNDLASKAKYFIKTDEYEHQNEYRFMWKLDSNVQKPLIIHCPEAVEFCKRG